MKWFDKLCFTLGVLCISVCQHFLFSQPQHFWMFHTVITTLLVGGRIPIYNMKVCVFHCVCLVLGRGS